MSGLRSSAVATTRMRRDVEPFEDAESPSDAHTRTELRDRFGQRVALAHHGWKADAVEQALGLRVTVEDVRLSAALEVDVNREP